MQSVLLSSTLNLLFYFLYTLKILSTLQMHIQNNSAHVFFTGKRILITSHFKLQ